MAHFKKKRSSLIYQYYAQLDCSLRLDKNRKLHALQLPRYHTNETNINQLAGELVFISGYGLTRKDYVGKEYDLYGQRVDKYVTESPSHLQYAFQAVLDNKDCRYIVHDTYYQLCAVADGYTATCDGDSGGALTTKNTLPNYSTAFGIVSFGHKDCIKSKLTPIVYTRISSFLNFNNNAKADQDRYEDERGRQYIRSSYPNFSYKSQCYTNSNTVYPQIYV